MLPPLPKIIRDCQSNHYRAQKLAEEYATLKEKFQGSGLKLSAEMAQYIVRTGQKEQFAEYQRNNARQQGEERS